MVDGRQGRRLEVVVVTHWPTRRWMTGFLKKVRNRLAAAGGPLVRGITTDGRSIYPVAVASAFPGVPHQVCLFHVLQAFFDQILKAYATVRRELKSQLPRLPRGRPRKGQVQRQARIKRRLKVRRTVLSQHRYLLVKRRLTDRDRRLLRQMGRGLRRLVEAIYGLFDRRCRKVTALKKLARLRRRVARLGPWASNLQRHFWPDLERALNVLDHPDLPATSNAVERANRGYRKMQKSIYRVRTLKAIRGRIALDLLREELAPEQQRLLERLHQQRQEERTYR